MSERERKLAVLNQERPGLESEDLAELWRAWALELHKATIIVLSDRPPRPVDALFFYGRAPGDETGLFELAAELYRQGWFGKIVIVGTDGEHEGQDDRGTIYAGQKAWREQLVKLSVLTEDIISSPPAYNTKQENNVNVALAEDYGWTSAAILAHPYQVLRAMLGMIETIRQADYWMNVWTIAPQDTNWFEEVYGSQAKECLPRIEQIRAEFERIERYQAKGDLVSFRGYFKYLEQRDLTN